MSRDNRPRCWSSGGIGSATGHECVCAKVEGHLPEAGHECECGTVWSDPVDIGGGQTFQGIRMPSSALDHASERLGAIDDALGLRDPHALSAEDDLRAVDVVDFVVNVVSDVNPELTEAQAVGLVHVVTASLVKALDDRDRLGPPNVLAASTWLRKAADAARARAGQ